MQLVERLSTVLDKKGLSVLKFSKEVDISPYKVYKWLEGKGQPKAEDSKIIEEWLSKEFSVRDHKPGMTYTPHTASERVQITAPNDKDQRIAELEKRLEKAEKEKERLYQMLDNALQKR